MIENVVERGIKLGRKLGVSEIEVYAIKRTGLDIVGTIRGVERVSSGERVDVGVRVVIGKKATVQGGLVSRVEDVDTIVETAVKIASTLPEDPQWISLPRSLGKSQVEGLVDPRIREPDIEYFIEIAQFLLKKAGEIDKRAFTSSVSVHITTAERAIGNSYGETLREESTELDVFVSVKAVEAGEESGYYDAYSAPTLARFNPEEMISKATEVAVKTLGAKRVDTGVYELILIPRVFAGVLQSLIVPAVCADSVQKGRSPLKGRIGSQVISENLTMIDDGTYQGLTGTRGFDDEGVPTTRKSIFDRGTLKGFLYDTYTALVEGRSSTGNAFRGTPYSTPSPWISNLIVESGRGDLSDLVRDVRKGVVVYSTIGEWLSNPVSGLLNATITNGMYVENGEEKFPVRGVVISGNIYEVLKPADVRVSGEVESFGRYVLPANYIPKIVIAGK
ncbi:MAG: TldD/PmbA family protein [Sulfolobales archaeon]|nr:TldD/PmbA family protein [Sulfolobales archaeon]MDW8083170.1 TldD/PmbA family protein [Sulfolobales archaeon]